MKERLKNRFRKRQIRLLGFLTVLVLSVSFIAMTIPKIMAGDTQVSDLILQVESSEQEIILIVKDEHPEDTKIVLPLPEGITYTSNSNSNIGVTYDQSSKQLVIDWVEGKVKQVQLQLEAEQEGQYDFTARTVREGEPVTSLPCSIIIETAESSEKVIEQSKELSGENKPERMENNSTEKIDKERATNPETKVLSGVWGTAPWEYNEESGTIIIHEGELGEADDSAAWNNIGDGWTTLKKIVFDGKVIAPANSRFLFMRKQPNSDIYHPLGKVEEIENFSLLDTSKVTNMESMFKGLRSLSTLDLSSFDTSKVTNMYSMFVEVSSVSTLDLSSFDTRRVTNMSHMFNGVNSVNIFDLSSFDTSNVTNMSSMFYSASSASSINLSSFNTSSVTDMSFMFSGVNSVSTLDLSSFDTSSVTNMYSMFINVGSVSTLDLSSFDTSSVTNMSHMFNGVSSVTVLDLSSFDTSIVTDMSGMFMNASSVSTLDLSSFDTSSVMNMSFMFNGVSSLKEFKLGKNIKFDAQAGLPDRNPIATETGKWQNVGSGTTDNPLGKYIFTSTELLENYKGELMADTYVAQPIVTPLLTQVIEYQNQVKDGNNYTGDLLNFSVKIDNNVSNTHAFVKSGNIQISVPKSFEVNQESIEVKTVKGEKLKDIAIDLSSNGEESKIKISGESLEILTTEEVIINYSIKTTQSGDYITQSLVQYADGAGNMQPPVIDSHKVSIKQMPIENSLLPEDSSKYSDANEEFPHHTTLVKDEKTPMIFTLKNEDNIRNRTLSNFDIWFDLSNFDGTLEVDKDTFYIKENNSSDWKKIDPSQIDNSGTIEDKHYSITDLNVSLLKNDEIQIKFSILAKVKFTPKKEAITAQGIVQNSGVFSSTNTLSAKNGELRFEKVPELLTFETSKISNRTKEIKRKDTDWNLTVEDTRLEKKDWRVAVELSEPFKDAYGNEAKGDLLFFRNSLGEKQWINNNGTTIFDGTSGEEDYYNVSWKKDKGLLLEVAPGVVKAGNYQSTLNWTLIDAPA